MRTCIEEGESAFEMLTDKATGRSKHRWNDNIKMDLME
jgi:hypothetical protein